jgi:hypothetical protein
LRDEYGFKVDMEQRGGPCYFVEWTNFSINIKALHDCCDKKLPITIRVYDADSVGFDAVEYREEFDQSSKKTSGAAAVCGRVGETGHKK